MKRSSTFRHPLSIEELIGDKGVPPSSMTTSQPIVQPPVKASTSISTNPAISKRKDKPYTKPGVDKYYRCDEPEHRSNECSKRRPVNILDYEEEEDVLIETKLEDPNFAEEHCDPVSCVIHKVLCSQIFLHHAEISNLLFNVFGQG